MDCEKLFSKRDCLFLLETINACLACSTKADAKRIIDKVGEFIGFDHAVYGLAKLNPRGCIIAYETLNFSYPDDWLDLYRTNNFHLLDPIVRKNFRDYGLQYWSDTYNKYNVDPEFISIARDFRLVDGYAGGVINNTKTEGCIFSISGTIRKDPYYEMMLNKLIPHLHQTFSLVLSAEKKLRIASALSNREKEVLNWIKEGKSSWDIAVILNISERTVKFHVHNVMRKLDSVSRTHAIAIAFSLGLIDID